MPELYTALSVPVEEDLLPLSALLHQRGVPHRIIEEGGRQVLQVENEEQAGRVRELYEAWRGGELEITLSRRRRSASAAGAPANAVWLRARVTLALIGLSVLGFALVYLFDAPGVVGLLSFNPFEIQGGRPVFSDMGVQYWRLVTPIFLHFGWLHIVFNCLWLWELGSRIEAVMGQFNMLMLCLVIALVSNLSQAAYGGVGIFGGMSGVVYGLLGFAWVAPLLQPRWPIQPPAPVMLLMLGWLVACLVGLVETLGFGAIANAAHVGGLLSGAFIGVIFGLASRSGGDSA